jgi:hypothetical protein
VYTLDMFDIESQRVIDIEIVQNVNASERGNYQGNRNGSVSNEADGEDMGK